nr:MAG TPA: hypothetical protein [Caudoviricetes sp.]DAV62995.1 MAG TPA: hypothetical protein [Caudoviricetes sp.]
MLPQLFPVRSRVIPGGLFLIGWRFPGRSRERQRHQENVRQV